jgi:hypothetical protein
MAASLPDIVNGMVQLVRSMLRSTLRKESACSHHNLGNDEDFADILEELR